MPQRGTGAMPFKSAAAPLTWRPFVPIFMGLPVSVIVDAVFRAAIAAKGQRNSIRRRQPFVAR
jgi:hypothetical protein